jgi:hypothetical protein
MNWDGAGPAAVGLNTTTVTAVASSVATINRLVATNLNFLILKPPLLLGTFLSQRPSSALLPKPAQMHAEKEADIYL